MTWLPLLLADPSPCLRRLVLCDLMARGGDDTEVRELDGLRSADPLVADLIALQGEDGSWARGQVGAEGSIDRVRATALALSRLGYGGFGREHEAVRNGAGFLLDRQRRDGAWPLGRQRDGSDEGEDGYRMMPLQTALPLRGLALCGYAEDEPCERAYEWLLAQRIDDGAWPTGVAAGGVYGYVAGYRRLPHSRWGCRSNTTGALACLALHPELRHGPEARRGLDLLLGRDTHDRFALGHEVARVTGAEAARGFLTFYARFDAVQVLDLCWRIGATLDDERVAGLVEFVRGEQGDAGLWEFPARPQAGRWVTFDLLRSLSQLGELGDWVSTEPLTPFQAYPRRRPRF